MKVLLIQTASIGDVILTTPVLEALHASFPEAVLDIAVKKGMEPLFTGHPFLNKVLTWDKQKGKYKNLCVLLRQVRSGHYDEVVTMQRFMSSGFLTLFSGARITSGFDKNPCSPFFTHRIPHIIGSDHLHEIDRNISLVAHMGIKGRYPVRLYPGTKEKQKLAGLITGPYICIAPSSLWSTKQLPVDKWVALMDGLPDGHTCFILGSRDDADLARLLKAKSRHPRTVLLTGELSFLESALLMKGASMNFSNDSAPLHLASAVNAPVTAIYCSTLPSFGFGPLSEKSYIVEARDPLPCRPCGIHGLKACPEGHFKCGNLIDVSELLATIPQ